MALYNSENWNCLNRKLHLDLIKLDSVSSEWVHLFMSKILISLETAITRMNFSINFRNKEPASLNNVFGFWICLGRSPQIGCWKTFVYHICHHLKIDLWNFSHQFKDFFKSKKEDPRQGKLQIKHNLPRDREGPVNPSWTGSRNKGREDEMLIPWDNRYQFIVLWPVWWLSNHYIWRRGQMPVISLIHIAPGLIYNFLIPGFKGFSLDLHGINPLSFNYQKRSPKQKGHPKPQKSGEIYQHIFCTVGTPLYFIAGSKI